MRCYIVSVLNIGLFQYFCHSCFHAFYPNICQSYIPTTLWFLFTCFISFFSSCHSSIVVNNQMYAIIQIFKNDCINYKNLSNLLEFIHARALFFHCVKRVVIRYCITVSMETLYVIHTVIHMLYAALKACYMCRHEVI